jgi:5'(3')-deoxyribonucleotidase
MTGISVQWLLKKQLPELFKLFDYEDFYGDTLVVMDNAIEIINKLSMQNEVIICSKHNNSRRPITQKWIYQVFPSVKLVFTDSFDKSIVGQVDIAIDDKPEALASINAKYKILYGRYLWNECYSGLRLTNWLSLYRIITKIAELDNKL